MPYFLLFNTGTAVTSTVLYLVGMYVAMSTTSDIVISVIGGVVTVIGFAIWDRR
jgi:hypothetical protein